MKTTEFKAVERFVAAQKLAKDDPSGALKERFLGLRQMGKEHTRQVETRTGYLKEVYAGDPEKLACVDNRLVGIKDNIEEANRMIGAGADPVDVEKFLQSRNTGSEKLSKQISEVYGVLAFRVP